MGTPRMPRFDVTIAGELNLDLILYGLPDELPPERELLADRMMLTLGSSSSIVAHNLAALGNRVGFQSRIADDQFGQIALERLKQGGVGLSRVRLVAGATKTRLTVILQRNNREAGFRRSRNKPHARHKIGRAHVLTPVTPEYPMPPSS